MTQSLILRGERSGLWTRIVMESVSSCARMKYELRFSNSNGRYTSSR